MKQNPLESALRERMQPGVLSRDGFLGNDNRDIGEIAEADSAVVKNAGLEVSALADLIDEIHEALEGTMETTRELFGGRLKASLDEGMGGIVCPFADGFRAHKGVLTVQTPQQNLRLTPLHAHLIRQHGFFQGRGSTFRVEPNDLINLYFYLKS